MPSNTTLELEIERINEERKKNKVQREYTALQTLHLIANNGKWEKFYSLPNTPVTKRPTKKRKLVLGEQCPLPSPVKVCRMKVRKQPRKKADKNKALVMVFKRYGPGSTAHKPRTPCGSTFLSRRGCKEPFGCKICGSFVDMEIEDLERRIPGLRTQ